MLVLLLFSFVFFFAVLFFVLVTGHLSLVTCYLFLVLFLLDVFIRVLLLLLYCFLGQLSTISYHRR